jgi:hypothetical protein
MKNSAWYHNLWQKKLDELPLKTEANAAWNEMQQLLDQHLPGQQQPAQNQLPSSNSAQLFSIKGVLISASIGIITAAILYYTVIKPIAVKKRKSHTEMRGKRDSVKAEQEIDTASDLKTDTLNSQMSETNDTLNRIVKDTDKSSQLERDVKPVTQNIYSSKRTSIAANAERQKKRVNSFGLNKNLLIKNEKLSFDDRETSSDSSTIAASSLIPNTTQVSTATVKDTIAVHLKNSGISIANSDSSYKADNRNPVTLSGGRRNRIVSSSNSSTATTIKSRTRQPKIKKAKPQKDIALEKQWLAYGLKAGLNVNANTSPFLGVYSSIMITPKFSVSPEVTLNTVRKISGEYSHPSYFRPDSIPPFTITDSRSISVVEIPLNLAYQLTNTISIKAGPILSIPFKQRNASTKIGTLPDRRDTLNSSRIVNIGLGQTVFTPKISVGFSAGLSYYINRFNFEVKYLKNLSPYTVTSPLGNYKSNYHTLQVGLGFQLNPPRNK